MKAVAQMMPSSISFLSLQNIRAALRPGQKFLALIGLSLVLWIPSYAPAQELARRLILKDGSYQAVTKYEIKGERVRYMSAERNEWEELPTSLVDWPATEKYEKDRAAGDTSPAAVRLNKEVENEREFDETKLPEVAPGLRLPQDSGVYLLDSFNGEPQLVEVQQSASDLAQSGKVNVFRGVMSRVGSIKENIEIDGDHARVQSHVDVPSFYIKIEEDPAQPDQADKKTGLRPDEKTKNDSAANTADKSPASASQTTQQPQPEQSTTNAPYRIVRAETKSGRRIVGDVKRAVNGKVSQQQTFVKTTTNRVKGGWLKVTPVESLAPGEYAVVEMIGKDGMNLYVWDFGVNPKAPANANPWKPETKADAIESTKPATNETDESPK